MTEIAASPDIAPDTPAAHPDAPFGLSYQRTVRNPFGRYAGPWWKRPVLSFDTETTGINVERARLVTWSVTLVDPDGRQLIDDGGTVYPDGFEIPEESSRVHGVDTETARMEGEQLPRALERIIGYANLAETMGVPLLAFNAPFDLTITLRELERAELPVPRSVLRGPVIDPLVIDRAYSRRKGKRNLTANAEHYGVKLENAHTAAADALAAALVLYRQVERYEKLQGMGLFDLHRHQAEAYAADKEGFEAYLRRERKDDSVRLSREWPYRRERDETLS